MRNVRITAIAAIRPTASQLVVIDGLDDVGGELKGQARDQPARVAQPDLAPLVAGRRREHQPQRRR